MEGAAFAAVQAHRGRRPEARGQHRHDRRTPRPGPACAAAAAPRNRRPAPPMRRPRRSRSPPRRSRSQLRAVPEPSAAIPDYPYRPGAIRTDPGTVRGIIEVVRGTWDAAAPGWRWCCPAAESGAGLVVLHPHRLRRKAPAVATPVLPGLDTAAAVRSPLPSPKMASLCTLPKGSHREPSVPAADDQDAGLPRARVPGPAARPGEGDISENRHTSMVGYAQTRYNVIRGMAWSA